MHSKIAIFAVVVIILVFRLPTEASAVRMSFLNDVASLDETIRVLTNNGCGQEATSAFRRIVNSHYAEGFRLDRSKFPEAQAGFYSFPTMTDVVKALPHRLCDSEHYWDFNCFDTVIILAAGKLQIGIQPDESFGPFLISTTLTNGDEAITLAATARDAFVQMVSQPRIGATDRFFPKSNQDARISLTAELFRWHLLPNSSTNATVERDVWSTLRSDWRRAGVRFPEKFQVVLYHKANLRGKNICTHHTGLLFRRGTAYTYLEKAGGKGPFVRLDFDEKSDLIPWISGVFTEREHQNDVLFVTFNDSDIIKLSR